MMRLMDSWESEIPYLESSGSVYEKTVWCSNEGSVYVQYCTDILNMTSLINLTDLSQEITEDPSKTFTVCNEIPPIPSSMYT